MKTYKFMLFPSRGVLRFLPLLFVCSFAHATAIHFEADLSGPAESPANTSPGLGVANVYFDDTAQTLDVDVTFWGLVGLSTASHIHAATALPDTGTAGVATEVPFFDSFPIGVTSGFYSHLFDLSLASSYNPAYIASNGGTPASASMALEEALLADKAYLNIHSTVHPGGEIRGFLHEVPDGASTVLLLSLAVGALFGLSRIQKLRTC